ncbi:MAG: SdrD B-like domain-containing protein, partial [Anaerolineae bacterium]
ANVTTIFVRQATISFTANGTPYTLPAPDARIIFDPAASTTTTSFDSAAQQWVTRVSPGNFSRNVFAGGLALTVPAGGFPGSTGPVTWTAAFTVDQPGVTFTWNWAAAVYTSFSTNYNAVGVKPVDGNTQNPYDNNDQAGTPENYKGAVTAGATGNGGSNYTGSWTGNRTVTPCRLYQIGDLVWNDANGDGLQTAGESGLGSVQVNLFSAVGVLLDSTMTQASGAFALLAAPGDYYLEFVAPASYVFTQPNQGADPALDSDADPLSGQTPVFILGAAADLTWDAGLHLTASLGDRVWYDRNHNGVQDDSEPGAPDVGVFLYDEWQSLVDVQLTDENGYYAFDDLHAGDYIIQFELADGYAFTAPQMGGNADLDSDADPDTGETAIITLAAGGADSSWDAGLVRLGALGDRVWYDANQNGLQNIGEPGLPNVPLTLYRDSNGNGTLEPGVDVLVATRVTSADGSFLFNALAPAAYFVDVGTLPGATSAAASVSGPQSLPDPGGPLTLTDGQVWRDADFGYVLPPGPNQAIVGDSVWFDGNSDGRQQRGEPGIANLQICATPAAGGAAICAQTDANGHFLLALAPGVYSVAPPTPPAGLQATVAVGTPFSVAAGEQALGVDLGYGNPTEAPLGSIGNLVFNDANYDGVFDAGDSPLAGVTVDMIQDSNENDAWDAGEPILATVTTNAALDASNGNYIFLGVPAGRFLIHVSDTNGALLDYNQGSLGQPDTDNHSQSDPYVVVLASGDSSVLADFGYYVRIQPSVGLIGNQVWMDNDGDGLYSAGGSDEELAGVTLELLQNSVVTRTVTSGAGGAYAFTGLAAGAYQVRVADPFGVLNGYMVTALGPQPGADANNQAQPFSVTLTDGGAVVSADFGYRRAGVTVGGIAWLDSNGNGIYNTGEQMMNNVNLRITNSGGATMGDVITGPAGGFASGLYSLGNLAAGQYTVAFLAGPPGYALIGPASLTTAYLALGQSDLNLNFPFINPTAVQVVDFAAWQLADGRVRVAWQTAAGAAGLEFHVWRATSADGIYQRLTSAPIAGQEIGGASYEWVDETAVASKAYFYRLEALPSGQMIGPVSARLWGMQLFLPLMRIGG